MLTVLMCTLSVFFSGCVFKRQFDSVDMYAHTNSMATLGTSATRAATGDTTVVYAQHQHRKSSSPPRRIPSSRSPDVLRSHDLLQRNHLIVTSAQGLRHTHTHQDTTPLPLRDAAYL